MADNSRRTPFVATLNRFAEKKIADAIQLTGKALPCSVVAINGSIVTVKFEVQSGYNLPGRITIPMFGPIYIRYPIQVGDLGITVPADVYLGGISGLGGGIAGLDQQANLSNFIFLPISNTAWSGVDPNSVNVNGPNGVVLRDAANNSTFTLTPTVVTIQRGTAIVTIEPNNISFNDGTYNTTLSYMNMNWSLFIAFFNAHVHISGGIGSPTSAPTVAYTGPNIVA